MSSTIQQCEEEDLNLHSFRNQNLNLARLPVSPSSRGWGTDTYDFVLRTSRVGPSKVVSDTRSPT
jgi:hypothetical protein